MGNQSISARFFGLPAALPRTPSTFTRHGSQATAGQRSRAAWLSAPSRILQAVALSWLLLLLAPSAWATDYPNSIAASTLTSTQGATNSGPANATLSTNPRITATKAANPNPLVVGATGQTYTIAVTIASGPTTAPITIADTLPTGITISGTATTSGGTLSGCASSGSSLGASCQLATGLANGTYTVTIPISVAATATTGNNTANLSGGGDPTCTTATGEACDPSVTAPIAPKVTATKTASANPLLVGVSGQNYTIAVTIANGPTTAPITIADTLPTGITLSGTPTMSPSAASLTGCPTSGGNLTGCTMATGLASGTYTITVPISVASTAVGTSGGTNKANLSGGGDPNCTAAATNEVCDPSTPTTAVGNPPKVTATKAANPNPLVVGATGQTYTIAVTIANGPSTAPITIADTLPTGITISGTVTTSGGTLSGCSSSGSSLGASCQLATGLANGTYTVTIPISVAATATTGNNTANLSGGGDPSCTIATGEVCDPSVTAPIAPKVTATKTASANPLLVGVSGQNYTIAVTIANGPTTAPITIADTLPTGITLSGVPTMSPSAASLTGCPTSGGNLTGCTMATGLANGTYTITVPINVASTAVGASGGTNKANLGGGGDPNCTAAATNEVCDPSTPTTVVGNPPKVTATKTASANPLLVGVSGQSYAIAVTIANGPTTAAITIADTLPTGITLSGTPTMSPSAASLTGCPTSGGNLTGCTIATGLANGTYTITVPINVAAAAVGASGGNNTANLSGGGDPSCTSATGEACDPSTPTTAVGNPPKVTATKSASVNPLLVGVSGQSYAIAVTIANGPTTAAITIADTLPTGITLSGTPT
ncbi:hypothetical protein, partial [Rudaea sp. 3F27F6]